jgi:GNAT superfamily N-acetyltransferase
MRLARIDEERVAGVFAMGVGSALRGYVRSDGVLHLPRAALAALRVLDFHIFVIRRGELLKPSRMPEVVLHEDALTRLQRFREGRTDLPNEFWRDKINGASQVAILELDGEVAGIAWAFEYPVRRSIIELSPGEAELTSFYTVEKFRGRGLYRALLYFTTAWQLRQRPRIFAIAAHDNPTPLKGIPELGFTEVAVVHRRSFFGPWFSVPEMRIVHPFERSG